MSDDFSERYRAAVSRSTGNIPWLRYASPVEVLTRVAKAAEELGIDEWDSYGERGAVARLESEVAELLGTESAAFFPSGIMAQQAALRVWCDRSGSRRVAMPDRSHLLHHELDGPRLLHGLEIEHLTTGNQVATAKHLAAIPGRLGAVLVELPLRDAGCLLPTWDELVELSAACRERGVSLHLDGARIWESQPYYDKPFAEITALADSVYVSFYKGLGGLSGSCLAGAADVVDEARRWRKRMGGTIFRMTAEAVSALAGLRDLLPTIPASVAWAKELAAALPETIRTQPSEPQTTTFLMYAEGTADPVNERLLAHLEETGLVLTAPWWDTEQPGRIASELAISDSALEHDAAEIAALIGELVC